MEPTRSAAIAAAERHFDSGAFRDALAALIAHPSPSQTPDSMPGLRTYLESAIAVPLTGIGFDCALYDNPVAEAGLDACCDAFQRHYRPTAIHGLTDAGTARLAAALLARLDAGDTGGLAGGPTVS